MVSKKPLFFCLPPPRVPFVSLSPSLPCPVLSCPVVACLTPGGDRMSRMGYLPRLIIIRLCNRHRPRWAHRKRESENKNGERRGLGRCWLRPLMHCKWQWLAGGARWFTLKSRGYFLGPLALV